MKIDDKRTKFFETPHENVNREKLYTDSKHILSMDSNVMCHEFLNTRNNIII